MEKKTNWSAVFNYLSDAHDYFDGDDAISGYVKESIERLMDIALEMQKVN